MTDADEPEDQDTPPPGGGKRYVTRAGAERLHRELLKLLHDDRPRVTAEVSAAAAQGDRSENAEYLYGKKKLREIDRRIRFLQRRLDTSTVVTPSDQAGAHRVFFGATVTVSDQDGQHTTYQLVGPDEIDTRERRISVDSPVGRALLGKAVGEEVSVRRPRGDLCLTIVTVQYL